MELPINYDQSHWTIRKQAREQYVKLQEGRCWYCDKILSSPPRKNVSDLEINRGLFPEGFFKYPIHLHHCHKTGMSIGAVHNICNAVLWQYLGE